TGIGYPSPLGDVVASEPEQKRFALGAHMFWIWNSSNAAEKARPGHVYFQKTVKLSIVPEEAAVVMTADNTFTFYVNGKLAGSGDDFKNGYLFDLRPFLKIGENTFVVDAVNNLAGNIPPTSAEPPPGSESPAGLLFYARLRHFEHGVQLTND